MTTQKPNAGFPFYKHDFQPDFHDPDPVTTEVFTLSPTLKIGFLGFKIGFFQIVVPETPKKPPNAREASKKGVVPPRRIELRTRGFSGVLNLIFHLLPIDSRILCL
jgi:hypothetical protein